MTIEPPEVGLLEAVHAGAGTGMPPMEIVAMAAFTAVFNITGQPAVSLPLYHGALGAAGRRAARGRALAGGPADPGGLPAGAGRSLGRPLTRCRLSVVSTAGRFRYRPGVAGPAGGG